MRLVSVSRLKSQTPHRLYDLKTFQGEDSVCGHILHHPFVAPPSSISFPPLASLIIGVLSLLLISGAIGIRPLEWSLNVLCGLLFMLLSLQSLIRRQSRRSLRLCYPFSLFHSSVFLHIGSDPLRTQVRLFRFLHLTSIPYLESLRALQCFLLSYTLSSLLFFQSCRFLRDTLGYLHAPKVKIECCVISLCTTSSIPHFTHPLSRHTSFSAIVVIFHPLLVSRDSSR